MCVFITVRLVDYVQFLIETNKEITFENALLPFRQFWRPAVYFITKNMLFTCNPVNIRKCLGGGGAGPFLDFFEGFGKD